MGAWRMLARLDQLVADTVIRHPARPALTFKDSTLSYAELWSAIETTGGGFRRLGLRRDERVAVYLDKRIETVLAMFGTSNAGGVFVPINPQLRPRQVGYILADCSARVLVTSPERLELLSEDLDAVKSVDHVVLVGPAGSVKEKCAGSREADGYTVTSWAEFQAEGEAFPETADFRDVIDVDMAAILYTSGSTGHPKGVVLSHRNLIAGAASVNEYLENTDEDAILAALPLSFDAGFSQLTTAFQVGAHAVLVNYLLAADVVRLCALHRISGITCVPPLWIQLADQSWPKEATAHLRYFANTGGRMPRATLDKLRAIFPTASPFLMYGLTEAFRSTFLDPAQVDSRPDSIGKAIPNAEVMVVGPDGSETGSGEEGELVHRGALVALGYWNDPKRTSERFRPMPSREGALLTEMAVWSGDIVKRDDEGFLYFVGRNDEMIKTSGYRVSPTEVEEAAYDTGLVGDAVAFGVEDERLGQHIVMVVSPAGKDGLDPSTLIAEMRKSLPLYMLPKVILIRPELPRSPNGKFDRNLLRQELQK